MQYPAPIRSIYASVLLLRVGSARRPCEFFPRTAAARVHGGIPISWLWQFQIISPSNVVQHWLINLRLIEQLLDPRQVLVSADAGRDGNDERRCEIVPTALNFQLSTIFDKIAAVLGTLTASRDQWKRR